LHIKPLVYIDHCSGLVEALANVRTRRKAVERLYTTFFEQVDLTGNVLRVAVLHGNMLDDARRIAERIWQEFSPAELLINMTGPVLGLHTGPGALALCGYAE
jgi:fatty acid-binding protein DegV